MKTLMVLRGLPGAGKTTLANWLGSLINEQEDWVNWYAADDWMVDSQGNYHFDRSKLGECHSQCKTAVEWDLSENVDLVIVHNTLTMEVEVEEYEILARRYGYQFISLIVENRHGNKSLHNVPDTTLDKFRARFSIKL